MTLIKDLIDLPTEVHRGDFVLRLTEGVTKPEETLRDYVVTPQLEKCFDRALDFIKSAIDWLTRERAAREVEALRGGEIWIRTVHDGVGQVTLLSPEGEG